MRLRRQSRAADPQEEVRQRAIEDARTLALDLYHQRPRPVTPYNVGVVLDPGEILWAEFQAVFTPGPTASHYGATPPVPSPWLITSLRIVGRLRDDRLYGWRWDHMVGCRLDLSPGREHVALQSLNVPSSIIWTGPCVFPLAVAVVYRLHGQNALLDHPGLYAIRIT